MSVKQKEYSEKKKIKPLVGDNVEIEVLDETERTGNIINILPRKSELIRPAVANVDQALVVLQLQNQVLTLICWIVFLS